VLAAVAYGVVVVGCGVAAVLAAVSAGVVVDLATYVPAGLVMTFVIGRWITPWYGRTLARLVAFDASIGLVGGTLAGAVGVVVLGADARTVAIAAATSTVLFAGSSVARYGGEAWRSSGHRVHFRRRSTRGRRNITQLLEDPVPRVPSRRESPGEPDAATAAPD
jgi:hypothetical protein